MLHRQKEKLTFDFPQCRQLPEVPEAPGRQPLPCAGCWEWGILAVLTCVSITGTLVSCSTQGSGSTLCPRSILRGGAGCGWHLGTMLPVPMVTSWQWQEGCQLVALGLKRALIS